MRILVIEDEERVAAFIRKGLEEDGYVVDVAADGGEGLARALGAAYDGIILDMMLPGSSGFDVVRELRQRNVAVPVLAVTARGALNDRVAGLDAGCDDYLPKPFAFSELLARLRALLRRGPAAGAPVIEYAGLRLSIAARTVERDGKMIELTNKEYQLLETLLRCRGQVLTRTALLESVWGYDFETDSNILDVYINFLRKKIDRGHERKLVHTVRGVGYVLRDEGE
jgi:DNA-binding response OmpR family regulator